MVDFSEGNAQQLMDAFLGELREAVSQRCLDKARIPGWISAARVRAGWVKESIVAVFEDTLEGDTYDILGRVGADAVVLLNVEEFVPSGACLQAREGRGFIILQGSYREQARSVLRLVGKRLALFDCGYAGYHGPRALFNLFIQYGPTDDDADTVAMRFVPFALYLHRRDAIDPARVWRLCEHNMMDALVQLHNSGAGDFYERRHGQATAFALTKSSGVIVLGKDSGPELQELIEVRDYLRAKGYDAELIKDLPEVPMMSNEEKVRAWALASRFCVMVDRTPAGHIAEYMMLKGQRTILALLRPQGSGSTYMIGDDALADLNFVKVFEFNGSALGVLAGVIQWAEGIAQGRAQAYDRAYPWRGSSSLRG